MPRSAVTSPPEAQLADVIRAEWQAEQPPAILAAAEAARQRFGDSVAGVLFYGSCLRTGEVDGKVVDFYVLVDSYRAAYSGRAMALANRLLPPNVFYVETEARGITVRSKVAVISLDDFDRRTRPSCLNVSVWARFSQPCVLLLARDGAVEARVAGAVARAVTTMLAAVLPLAPRPATARDLWTLAFDRTYAAELRSERRGKGLELYLLDQDRYDRITEPALDALQVSPDHPIRGGLARKQPDRARAMVARAAWAVRTVEGKTASLARLIKAAFTFDGGIDYLAWKISRHSGIEITVTPWQRRHPILAGLTLFWRLRRQGAFR